MNKNSKLDLSLLKQSALAFSASTDLGCSISLKDGTIVSEYGHGCGKCKICQIANIPSQRSFDVHVYGMSEAERFGGKYIYSCPMGFTCFVSLILDHQGVCAKITVGPFLMVEKDDYISCDLELFNLAKSQKVKIIDELDEIPYIETEKVNMLSNLLFMVSGYINNSYETQRMLEKQDADAIQGQLNSHIMHLKSNPHLTPYPFDTEKALLKAIMKGDEILSNKLLNEIYGHIFFISAGDFKQAKSRILELFILISRSAIDAGADSLEIMLLNENYISQLPEIINIDDLCFWVTKITKKFLNSIFSFVDAKHATVIRKTINYINSNFEEKITLEDTADKMYLSSAYFSRLFKRETGENFNNYLNKVRIEESKKLLFNKELKLSQIALMVGFEDQSYFTKVFKKIVGVSPFKYRETL